MSTSLPSIPNVVATLMCELVKNSVPLALGTKVGFAFLARPLNSPVVQSDLGVFRLTLVLVCQYHNSR